MTKMESEKAWNGGYQEIFAYEPGLPDRLGQELERHKGGTALEIGCGNGVWTKRLLLPRFDKVICIDVINPPNFQGTHVEYRPVEGSDFSCGNQAPDSVDFVYSFGTFCHLRKMEIELYLKTIYGSVALFVGDV